MTVSFDHFCAELIFYPGGSITFNKNLYKERGAIR